MSQPAVADQQNSPHDASIEPPAWRQLPFVRSLGSVIGAAMGLFLVLLIFGAWRPDRFLTGNNFTNVFKYNYHFAVAAVGATFVIITAGIDLSVGSTMALAGVACAMAVKGFTLPEYDPMQAVVISGGIALLCGLCAAGRLLQRGAPRLAALKTGLIAVAIGAAVSALLWRAIAGRTSPPLPVGAGVVVAIGVGALVGLLNGTLITTLSLPPFIVTLGTLEGVRGFTLYVTNGVPVTDLPASLRWLHRGSLLGLPPNVWIALAVILVAAPVLHYSVLGRYVYAIGSNEKTARLCGVRVERWKTACYVIAGITAGLAGVMMVANFGSAMPDEFKGAELTVIAAVVIGGTSLFGGEGTILGSILGVLMLGFLWSGCNIAGVRPNLQRVFIGATIVLAAAVDRFRHISR
jgi:ribose/xylose/arabinose/galactoside ABC-type transport system permease subunit